MRSRSYRDPDLSFLHADEYVIKKKLHLIRIENDNS